MSEDATTDLRELCAAVQKAVTAMRHHSAAASMEEGRVDISKSALDAARDHWRRFDQEANALTSFAAILAARYPSP